MNAPELNTHTDGDGRAWVDVTWPRASLWCLRSGDDAITACADDVAPGEIGESWSIDPTRPSAVPPGVRVALLPVLLAVGLLLGMSLRAAWALSWSLR